MQMKKYLALALMAVGFSVAVSAQTATEKLGYKSTPYLFVGIQGGAQTTFTNFKVSKLITPTASVSFGGFFSPVVGARLHVNGLWNKSGIKENGESNFTYKYNYVNTDLDLLLNLCTLFGRKDYYPLNVYLIGGFGVNYAWNNDDLYYSAYRLPNAWEKDYVSHNFRLGAMLDYNLTKHLSLNLEVSSNFLSDRYNSKVNNSDDCQLTAQIGLAYKFGFKKKPVEKPVEEVPVQREPEPVKVIPATPVVPSTPPVKVQRLETIQKDIFFDCAKSDIRESEVAKVQEAIAWMQSHPTAKATITGHADAGTGNPRINARYAKARAESVAKAFVDAGIDYSRLTVDSKGDTVMPYGDNEQSRVAIVIAQEK